MLSSFKKGLTLAEVLITMAIIGIVAAVVIPSLMNSNQQKMNGASLGSAVGKLQAGVINILETVRNNNSENANVSTLDVITMKDLPGGTTSEYLAPENIFSDQTGGILGIEENTKDKEYLTTYLNNQGYDIDNIKVYRMKKTSTFVIADTSINIPDSIGEDDVITRIFIDTNGTEGPNEFGEDVFLFGLLNSGQLVPAGSAAYNNNILNEEIPLYSEACAQGQPITDRRSCAARVMADNWEINYKL